MNPTTEKLMALATDFANSAGVIDSAQKQQALRLAIDAALSAPAWPIRGVRVEDDKVIVTVKGGNDAARWLCGEMVALIGGPQARAALSAPPGWKLVPIEPTPEMKAAAVRFANGDAVYKNVTAEALKIEEDIYGEVYEAMLAAAPSPQEQT